MRIVVEASTWWNRRGFGRFTRGLVSALLEIDDRNEYALLVDRPSDGELPRDVEVVHVDAGVPAHRAAAAESRRSLRDMWAMTRAIGAGRYDLAFFPAVYSYVPVPRGQTTLVTFHDAIAELHADLVFSRALNKLFWDLKVKLALRQADRLLCVSEDARRQVVQAHRVDSARIDVCTEGPDPAFAPRDVPRTSGGALGRYGVPDGVRFLLYVGGISPHKNVARLVRCFADARVPADTHLVLVGDKEADGFLANFGEIEASLREDPVLAARVHFTGFVPDEALAEAYNRAAGFVIPSYAEGFGLCPVEAMACGTPVLSSDGGSLPEVVGDAAVLFDPRDEEQMIEAMAGLLTSESRWRELAARSLARAEAFSWRRGAELALASFERTVGGAR